MYQVTATYPDGESLVFFEYWEESAEYHAQLAHPKQTKPQELDLQKVQFDGLWHFYSVKFAYSQPDTARPRALHVGEMHISLSYDEEEASRRLDAAMNTVAVAALRAQIRNVSQYAWPDGSLYYWFASLLPEAEFRATELRRFEAELERVSLHPFKLPRTYKDKDGKKKRTFTHHYGESRVRVSRVREETQPYRCDPRKGCLHLVDLFNGIRTESYLSLQRDNLLAVPEKEAESFQEGLEVAYGHQNLFTPWAEERRSPEEIQAFAWGYYLARLLQLLTET